MNMISKSKPVRADGLLLQLINTIKEENGIKTDRDATNKIAKDYMEKITGLNLKCSEKKHKQKH